MTTIAEKPRLSSTNIPQTKEVARMKREHHTATDQRSRRLSNLVGASASYLNAELNIEFLRLVCCFTCLHFIICLICIAKIQNYLLQSCLGIAIMAKEQQKSH